MTLSRPFLLYTSALVAASFVLGGGCAKDFERNESPREQISPEAASEAKEIYKARCATCHGETGNSDGPSSATLKPVPAKFTDAAWQRSATDRDIEEIIKKGGSAVDKSLLMPPNLDLSPQTIVALRAMVRDFGKAGSAAPQD